MKNIYLAVLIFFTISLSAHNFAIKEGFVAQLITSDLVGPTSLAVAPDGRIFITEKRGTIKIVENGELLETPFLTLNVDQNGERGLSSILLDPDFDSNGYIYVYYTVPNSNFNRLSRFKANGNLVIPNSEVVFVDLNELQGVIHNAGAMRWGADTSLYLSVGDGLLSSNSQNKDVLLGKMLRLNRDGSIPEDNPYYNEYEGNLRYIYAKGLRNSFTFDIHPTTGQILANDVGQGDWEEINEIKAGRNYGWPAIEGPITNETAPDNYEDPFFAYFHDEPLCAVVGGAFYAPKVQQFPDNWKDKYIFSDYCSGLMQVLDPVNGVILDTLLTGAHWTSGLIVSPFNGHVYYTTFSDGELYGVQYVGNGSPFITKQPTAQQYVVGEKAKYEVEVVGDEVLTFQWFQNDNLILGADSSSFEITSIQLSDSGQTLYARISNDLGFVYTDTITIKATSNQRPSLTISSPNTSILYKNGDSLRFAGGAVDPEDGQLSASQLTWRVNFHHAEHFHPGLAATAGISQGAIYIDPIGETSTDVWYRVHLKATDSQGLTNETYVDIYPEIIATTLATSPSNLDIILDGATRDTDYSFDAVVGNERVVIAPKYQVRNDSLYQFTEWESGELEELKTFLIGDFSLAKAIYEYSEPFIDGEGTGLTAKYYPNFNFEEPYSVTQIDREINFQPDYGAFLFGFPQDSISIEWSGSLLAPVTGEYTMYLDVDDIASIDFNGIEILNAERALKQVTVNLIGGQKYPITIKYKEARWLSKIKLFWSHKYQSKQIIPAKFLYPEISDIVSQNILKLDDFIVFPNPTNGIITFAYNDSLPFTLLIFNANGQVVHQKMVASDAVGNISVDVSTYSSGVYFFQISNGKKISNGKFMKN